MWFFWIIVWVLLCMAVASVAKNRFDRDYTSWLLLSLFLSPLIGILALVIAGSEGKKCSECSEVIKLTAKVCKHCGFKFSLSDDKQRRLGLIDETLAEAAAAKSGFWKDKEQKNEK